MRRTWLPIALAAAASLPSPALSPLEAQTVETGFLDRTVTLDGVDHRYQVYVPRAYASAGGTGADGGGWPVILFLHGAGERGDDGLVQTQVGLGAAIRLHPERWPAIAVFPQVPEDQTWQGTAGDAALAALEQTLAEFRTDADRVYLTGLSMGGNGAWYLGYRHPDRFAALVAICGFVAGFRDLPAFTPAATPDPFAETARGVATLPVWIVHGDADVVVPVDQSRRMAAALEALGADVTYHELPGVNHNSWDPAFADEALPAWLFDHSRR